MGGIISMQYCMDYPSEVKALVLIATRAHRNPRLKLRILFALFQARLGLLMDFTAPRKYDRTAKKFPYGYQDMLEKQVKDMLSSNTPKEVFEWWAVSDWLANKLGAHGCVLHRAFYGLTLWGRCTTGQAISMDHVIECIVRELYREDPS